MLALITAAGKGTRLGKLMQNSNKCLIRVSGRSLLKHSLNNLRAHSLPRPLIVTGYAASRIKEELNGCADFIYNPHYEESGPLVSIWSAREKLIGKSFVILMGDILYDADILKRCIRARGRVVMCVQKKEHAMGPIDSKVSIHNGRVIEMGKNLDEARTTGEFVGVVKIDRTINRKFFNLVEKLLMEGKPQGLLMDVLMRVQGKGESIKIVYTDGKLCMEVDTPRELKL